MPFVPLAQSSTPAGFPRVSPSEQAERDATAEQLVADEFDQDMPDDSRAALETEYRQRFGKSPPVVERGFVPLAASEPQGFVPLQSESSSILKTIALENPATAIGETALNFGSQMVALPIAGIAGLATAAGNALGLTDKTGADTVHSVGEALTYQPRGEFGKAATDLVSKPFQALAAVGETAGEKTLDVTGSPMLATAVDTAINAAPMAISPAAKGIKSLRSTAPADVSAPPIAAPPVASAVLSQHATDIALEGLSRATSIDDFITTAAMLADIPVEIPLAPLPLPLPPIAAMPQPRAGLALAAMEMQMAKLDAGFKPLQSNPVAQNAIPIQSVVPERITPMAEDVRPGIEAPTPARQIVPQRVSDIRPEQNPATDQVAPLPLDVPSPPAVNVPPAVPRIEDVAEATAALPVKTGDVRGSEIRQPPSADAIPSDLPIERAAEVSPPGLSANQVQELLASVRHKKVSRSGVIEETGERFRLDGLDAVQAIKEVRSDIEALETLQDMAGTTNIRRSIAMLQESGKLPDSLAEEVRKATAEHAKNGYLAKEAAIEAVGDVLHEARKELKDVYTQVGIDWNLDSLAREKATLPSEAPKGSPGVPTTHSTVPEAAPAVPDKIADPAMIADSTKRAQEAVGPVRGPVPLEAQRLPDSHGSKRGFTPLAKTADEAAPPAAEQAMASGRVQNGAWNPGSESLLSKTGYDVGSSGGVGYR